MMEAFNKYVVIVFNDINGTVSKKLTTQLIDNLSIWSKCFKMKTQPKKKSAIETKQTKKNASVKNKRIHYLQFFNLFFFVNFQTMKLKRRLNYAIAFPFSSNIRKANEALTMREAYILIITCQYTLYLII